MLGHSGHSLKAALLKGTAQAGGRGAAEGGGGGEARLLHYGALLQSTTDPTRALSRLHALLLEGDLRQLWAAAKARLRQQLRDACGTAEVSEAAARRAAASPARVAPAELQPLYGSDGPLRSAVMYVLAHGSRGFMTRANDTSVEGAEHMAAALARAPGRPLITVCNHVASMDDPLVMSTILPPEVFADPAALRWTLCASDRCFHRAALVPFFRAAKVLPVERGAGMFQAGLAAAEERLRAGDWVHIFPEGTRSRDGALGPVRKGVGRLVAACGDADPLVLPFVHSGMEEVLPKGSLLPKVNKQVKVLVGAPVDVSDLLAASAAGGWSEDALYSAIASRIGGAMAGLKAALDGAPLDGAAAASARDAQAAALAAGLDLYDPADNAHRAATLWERLRFRAQHREWAETGLAAARARLAAAAASLSRAAGAGGGGAGAAPPAPPAADARRRLLARATDWLSPDSLCSSAGEYYSYQRSVAMMQLLQARV
ncbi:N-acylphosphatidylethanolamine synthase [Scenedesmus sp. PABB004]|nr:N-acylphosphatidylethanolamine synthase [Scenedesmus sp. PABB004]